MQMQTQHFQIVFPDKRAHIESVSRGAFGSPSFLKKNTTDNYYDWVQLWISYYRHLTPSSQAHFVPHAVRMEKCGLSNIACEYDSELII